MKKSYSLWHGFMDACRTEEPKPMVNWSNDDLMRHEAKHVSRKPAATSDAVKIEKDLHDQIERHCVRRGWLAIHSRMDKATTTRKGVCDFIIFTDSFVHLIECKSKSGKLSEDQAIFIAWMRRLGWHVNVISSFKEFLDLPMGS